jgi:hypothetical protein
MVRVDADGGTADCRNVRDQRTARVAPPPGCGIARLRRRDPVTALAGTLAWMEAMAGQLYLAIMVARLVALSMADSSNPDTASRA